MPKVFISHSSKDKKFTLKLVQDLKDAGIPVWYDINDIRVGDSIIERIEQGLRECDYLVIVLSRASTNSRWVQEELSAAKTIEIGKRGVFILPVLIEDCNIPPLIATKRYADFRSNYKKGLGELLDVFGRTHIRDSETKRYQKLEEEWKNKIELIDREIRSIIRTEPGRDENEFYLTENYKDENIAKLRKDILDVLDIYRALRPLEKSSHLASYIDGSALTLAILGKVNDLQLEILQNRYPSMTGVTVGVYLLVGVTQATCNLKDESIWTFRKAIRIALDIEKRWEDALLSITYQLSRYISFFHMAPEQDVAVKLLLDDKYLEERYEKSIDSYRAALEKELYWHLDSNPDDRVDYANLMDAVGFFKEELIYLERARDDFPKHKEFSERLNKICEYIEPMESKGDHKLQFSGIHKMPPFFAEFGQHYRFDDLIEQYEGEFWNDIVLGLDHTIDSELIRRLFPEE
jgi:tetratricopeptide (TPR) repeat protein